MHLLGKRFKVSILITATLALLSLECYAEEEKNGATSHAIQEEAAPERELNAFELHELKFKKQEEEESESFIFKGFSAYRSEFVTFCRLIDEDGQKAWLEARALDYSKSLKECGPCRSLYSSLKNACKVKPLTYRKKRRPKNGEEEPGEKIQIQQLNPSTELIDHASETFRKMAGAKKFDESKGFYLAVSHLIDQMRLTEGKSPTEREYFETLAEYMEAPFRSAGLTPSRKKSVKSPQNVPILTPRSSLDDLF